MYNAMKKKRNLSAPAVTPWLNKFLKRLAKLLLIVLIFVLFISSSPRILTELAALGKIHSTVDKIPSNTVAIVFGAGLTRDGSVTLVLRDRVDAAAELYFAGKVQKLLMSGDNRYIDYNEPAAMYEYAVSIGIPPEDIVLDYAGRRTYDTCYRANAIFGLDSAILVTQRFHLPRALFLCSQLGVDAEGYSANVSYYLKRSRLYWNIRELPATFMALVDAWITHPLPVLGDPEPIFPDTTQVNDQSSTLESRRQHEP